LKDTGFVEGQNVSIEYRFANQNERISALAADLVRRQVAVIFVPTGGSYRQADARDHSNRLRNRRRPMSRAI
jgi:hypothetical protein